MSASTKLSTSVKALSFLALTHPEPQSSKAISDAVSANASKLRQLLSMLTKYNIVDSAKGTSGGFILVKDPKVIHLQEIYCSIEDRKAFHLHVRSAQENQEIEMSEKFNTFFLDLFAEVQVDIENKFRRITLAQIMKKLNIKNNYK